MNCINTSYLRANKKLELPLEIIIDLLNKPKPSVSPKWPWEIETHSILVAFLLN